MVADKRAVVNRILIALAVLVVLVVGAAVWYVNDFYHADDVALVAVADENGVAAADYAARHAGDGQAQITRERQHFASSFLLMWSIEHVK